MFAQADTLAAEIEQLSTAGAKHILVNPIINNKTLSAQYSQRLFGDLDQSGIAYTKSDVHAMVQDVLHNPTAYGFTATTVHPGVVGTDTNTESALIEPDTTHGSQRMGTVGRKYHDGGFEFADQSAVRLPELVGRGADTLFLRRSAPLGGRSADSGQSRTTI